MARRIDCAFLAKLVTEHRLGEEEAFDVAQDLAYGLVKEAYRLWGGAKSLTEWLLASSPERSYPPARDLGACAGPSVQCGKEFFFLANPGLGLWAYRGKLRSEAESGK